MWQTSYYVQLPLPFSLSPPPEDQADLLQPSSSPITLSQSLTPAGISWEQVKTIIDTDGVTADLHLPTHPQLWCTPPPAAPPHSLAPLGD